MDQSSYKDDFVSTQKEHGVAFVLDKWLSKFRWINQYFFSKNEDWASMGRMNIEIKARQLP